MKLKFVAAAAVAAFVSTGALAVDLGSDLGPVPPTASFNATHSAGSFMDTWSFQLSSLSAVAASLTNVSVTFAGSTNGGISGFAASLNGTALDMSGSTFSPLGVPMIITTQILAGGNTFGPGNFVLNVSGVAGAGGASYGGNIVATPVPEPETLAMMLAGLGALGFVARRRKQS